MKKKLLTILVILVLAMGMILATACENGTLLTKNNERDMSQITATVKYAGRTSEISKTDFTTSMSNTLYYASMYYQYGYTQQYDEIMADPAAAFEKTNKALATNEAYVLKCIDILYNKAIADEGRKANVIAKSTIDKEYDLNARIAEIESLLSNKYLVEARKAYNKDMEEGLKKYRDAYESEIENGTRTNKSIENVKELVFKSLPDKLEYEKGASAIKLNGLKVSVLYNDDTEVELDRSDFTVTGFDSSEVKDENEITVTFGNTSKTFNVKIVEAKPSRPAMPKDDEEDNSVETLPELFLTNYEADLAAANEADDTKEVKALTESMFRFKKSLKDNYRTFEYYYLVQLKEQVKAEVEDMQEATVLEPTDDAIIKEYNDVITSQIEELKIDKSKYESNLSDKEKFKSQIVHTDGKYFYVQHVLFALSDDLKAEYEKYEEEKTMQNVLDDILEDKCKQIEVYVSNVNYDKDATCENENCDCKECENYKGEGPFVCDGTCNCEVCLSKRFVTDDFKKNVGNYVEGFSWNDDEVDLTTETVNVLAVMRAMFADLGTVNASSTPEERKEIIEKFQKWTYMCCDDTETYFTKLSDGQLGYLFAEESVEETSGFAEQFVALSKALGLGENAEDWTIYGDVGSVGAYGYCYTTFGIHVIMLTGIPAEDAVLDEASGYYISLIDSIVDYRDYKETDGINPSSVKAAIHDTIGEKAQSEASGKFHKDFIENEFTDGKVTEVNYYPNTYKDILKKYTA